MQHSVFIVCTEPFLGTFLRPDITLSVIMGRLSTLKLSFRKAIDSFFFLSVKRLMFEKICQGKLVLRAREWCDHVEHNCLNDVESSRLRVSRKEVVYSEAYRNLLTSFHYRFLSVIYRLYAYFEVWSSSFIFYGKALLNLQVL